VGAGAYDQLPPELKELKQWCVAGGNKAPSVDGANGLYPVDVKRVDQFYDFDGAVAVAEKYKAGIGFVLTEDDPYSCIDLDVKDSDSRDRNSLPYPSKMWTPQEQLDWYTAIVDGAQSYSELSTSGKGVHIWVKGDIGKGRNRNGLEIYSSHRFIICTGHSFDSVTYQRLNDLVKVETTSGDVRPICERQYFLDSLKEQCDHGLPSTESFELEEQPEVLDDDRLWERAAQADNRDKFLRLAAGHWQGEYESQSEADLALMSMFCFYSDSNEQCRRLFRFSELGKRDKSTKDNRYLDATLTIIRARQAVEKPPKDDTQFLFDPSKMLAEFQAKQDVAMRAQELQQTVVNQPVQPVVLPTVSGMGWPVGVLGQLASFIYHSSLRPVKEVAITSALGLMAGITGKAYNVSGTGLNLHLLLVARSGVGKEALHSGAELVVRSVKDIAPTITNYFNTADYASGQALTKAFEDQQCFAHFSSEFGKKIERMSGSMQRGNDPMQSLRTVMTQMYSKSGHGSSGGGMQFADKTKNIKLDQSIAYTIVGETTPSTFNDSLTPDMMSDGFLSRFVAFEYMGERLPRNTDINTTIPNDLARILGGVINNSSRLIENNIVVNVRYTEDAQRELDMFDATCDGHINAAGDDEGLRQTWTRAHLKVLKMSAIMAVCDHFNDPVINLEHVEWAKMVVTLDAHNMRVKLEDGNIGISDTARLDKLLKVVKEFFGYGRAFPKSYNVPQCFSTFGYIPHPYLARRCAAASSFAKSRFGSQLAFKHTLQAALEHGYISEVETTSPTFVEQVRGTDAEGYRARVYRIEHLR